MRLAKSICLAALLLIACAALADEAPNRYRQSAPVAPAQPRVETLGEAGLGTGEHVPSQLEPGLAAIKEDFTARLNALREQAAASSTPEQEEALNRQMEDLKHEWMLAIAQRQLELARERGDTGQEAEIRQAIERMTNPTPALRQPVRRDPVTGEALEGGAR